MSPVVTLTLATLLSESSLISTCVLSEMGLPSTTLSPYNVFFVVSMVVLKPHFLRSASAISIGSPGWLSSFMFFAQSSCRPLLQEDCQVTIPMTTSIFVNLFFMEAVDVYQNHA